jgi:hypothetical protein
MQSIDLVRRPHALLILIALVLAINFVLALIAPPAVLPDPAKGFEVWRSMEWGAPWNHCFEPKDENISQDRAIFVAWWTPGQYFLPGILTRLPFGMSLGRAATFVTLLAIVAGIVGWYRLYRNFGFSELVALLACALLALSPGTAQMFGAYSGGTTLLLAFSPWAILLCLRLGCSTPLRVAALLMMFLVGFFLKSAFLTVALGACGAMAVHEVFKRRTWINRLTAALVPTTLFVVTLALAVQFYLRHGATPSDLTGNSGDLARSILFPLAAPLLGASSADIGLDLIFGHSDYAFPEWTSNPLILGALACVSLSLLACSIRNSVDRRYRIWTLSMFAAFAVVHTYLYLIAARVGCLAHYFQIPGLLVLPGVLASVGRLPRMIQVPIWLAFLLYLFAGPLMTARNYYLRAPKVVGVSGFTIEGSPELHAFLRRIDEEAHKRSVLIELGEPTWSLEIIHQRWFAGSMWHNSPDEIINAVKRGRPARLYIVLPQKMVQDGRARAILASHLDVHEWEELKVGSGVVYYPRDQVSSAYDFKKASMRPIEFG